MMTGPSRWLYCVLIGAAACSAADTSVDPGDLRCTCVRTRPPRRGFAHRARAQRGLPCRPELRRRARRVPGPDLRRTERSVPRPRWWDSTARDRAATTRCRATARARAPTIKAGAAGTATPAHRAAAVVAAAAARARRAAAAAAATAEAAEGAPVRRPVRRPDRDVEPLLAAQIVAAAAGGAAPAPTRAPSLLRFTDTSLDTPGSCIVTP